MKSRSTVYRYLNEVLKRLEKGNCGPSERLVGETAKNVLICILHNDTPDPISMMIDANIDDYNAGLQGDEENPEKESAF